MSDTKEEEVGYYIKDPTLYRAFVAWLHEPAYTGRNCDHMNTRTTQVAEVAFKAGHDAALSAPPPDAAVVVEALEGLVAKWREEAAAIRARATGRWAAMTADDARSLEKRADELTQLIERSKELIKERSNG